jgi:hypothetical protein
LRFIIRYLTSNSWDYIILFNFTPGQNAFARKNEFMKKILIILVITGCFVSATAQQSDYKYELFIGAKGGVTLSQVRFYPNVQTNFLQGNTGGLIFRMFSEPHIGFQVELNYIQKGWQEKPFTGDFAATTYFHRLNYVNMPVLTHVNIGKKAIRFILNLGPEVSYLISENQGFRPPDGITSSLDGYKAYYGNKIDAPIDILFGGGIGMECHFKGGSAISIEGRAFYSLPNLYDTKKYIYQASQSNGVQVTMAYLLPLTKARK